MEDGMWVVVSNCDEDEKFWTLISFKLYQLKLEAKVHQNYRLFIIINQASTGIIPGQLYYTVLLSISSYHFHPSYVFQHSFVVCLEPPCSLEEHVDMLVAAAPEDSKPSFRIAAHHAFIRQAQLLGYLSDEDYMVNLSAMY